MKKTFSFIAIFVLFAFVNINATNANENKEIEAVAPPQSCFSFYHNLFHEYYGGITLENVGDFNYLVAQCQALFENNQ